MTIYGVTYRVLTYPWISREGVRFAASYGTPLPEEEQSDD